ncbi:29163_t:CDS:2, partial [Gigaspora margarita]
YKNQGFIQLLYKQQSDEEPNCINENIEYKIENVMKFSNWYTLERTLKKHKLEQLNTRYRKNIGTIFINKLINEYNYLLAPYQKKFAPSLHSLLQEVFDEIKFLTQEYDL